jgi:hypothetical protein
MKCEYYNACGFITNTLRIDPDIVPNVEMTYCNGDKLECVRFCLHQIIESELIPDSLWPNDESGAMEVIKTKISFENQHRLTGTGTSI